MRLGLFVLLSLAGCAAQTSRSDVYIPPPYFDEGENLSSQNCGNETALRQNQWIVDVTNMRTRAKCFNFIVLSQRTILTRGDYCDFNKNDTTDLRVFPEYCTWRQKEEECLRVSVKVLDVMQIVTNPSDPFEITIMITEKMPTVENPLCLFNRDNVMDLQLQRDSPYFLWNPATIPPIEVNVTGQSNCSAVLSSDDLDFSEYYKIRNIPIQNILCVEETIFEYSYLINFYKGRYFLRGIKHGPIHRFYIDLLPYIDEIAMHAKDISALRPIPETKQPRGFTTPDNLSFPNCGSKPTSTRRKRENDDSSTELPSIAGQILGGNISQTGDHPWHAYIENSQTGRKCDGTLISPTVVLTAANCLQGSKAEDFIVSVGMNDKRQRTAPGVQRKKPSILITHPKYDSAEFISDDIGLIILSEKVEISDNIRPICLWNDDSDPNLKRVAGTEAMVVGFGLADNDTLPDKLQEVRLPIRTHKECYTCRKGGFSGNF
ncbi:uncharacterized protein LOC135942790 [Cloeon dipterum]|uniref:uncharacterized protein LOC135942790 n=1 Tax=Cloeon dipterum TaxID=197152 RepID=UPI00321FBFD9